MKPVSHTVFDILYPQDKESINEDVDKLDEEVDVSKVIKDLIDTPASDNNGDQGKFVQLLRGLAFSDDVKATNVVKKIMDMVNDKTFGKFI